MAEDIQVGADALLVDVRDDVATALRDLSAGERVSILIGDDFVSINLLQAVAFGHKISVRDITEGSAVHKYGEVIGRATTHIPTGSHVHVHNIEGIRGRGDQVQGRQQG